MTVDIEAAISQLETEISGQFGSGPRIKLIPHEDKNQMYPWAGAGPSWSDVFGWAKSLLDTNTAIARSPTWQNVVFAVTAGLGRSIQAVSGFVNLSIDYTSTVAQLTGVIIEMLLGEIAATTVIIVNLMNAANARQDALIQALNLQMQIDKLELQFQIEQTAKFVSAADRAWATETIFKPLYENIGQAEAQATLQFQGAMQETAKVQASITPIAILEATAVVAPALAAIAALQAFRAAQQTLNDTCTTPMCDLMGPKTNWAQIVKALEALLAVGATGAVLALTEHDLERIASAFAGIGSGSLNQFLAGFVGGGETLGTAGAGLLGDVGGIASTVLSDLGIPA
jgi:hypothetical protein